MIGLYNKQAPLGRAALVKPIYYEKLHPRQIYNIRLLIVKIFSDFFSKKTSIKTT